MILNTLKFKILKFKNDNSEKQKLDIFKYNEIFFQQQRIFNYKLINNIILNINGTKNKIFLNKINGNGKLILNFQNVSNNTFIIGSENTINQLLSITFYNGPNKKSEGVTVKIKNKNIFNGAVYIIAPIQKDKKIKIGNNNLFANNITIRGCSDHLIYDNKSKKQINKEIGIEIKNHIWLCEDSLILNKAKIPSNCVIAARSIVTKELQTENALYAGSPAIVKKENINWNIDLNHFQ